MSKRSAAFKKSLIDQAKNEILNDMREDYSNEFDNHGFKWNSITKNPIDRNEVNVLNKLSKMLGMNLTQLITFINDNYRENAFSINLKSELNKNYRYLSEAFNAGEKKEHERHLKAEDEAFQRGRSYGAEQRENELRAKFEFIEKTNHNPCNPCNKKVQNTTKYSNDQLNDIFEEINENFKTLNDLFESLKF